MADVELLRRVVAPDDGWYCVFSLQNKQFAKQEFFRTLEEVETRAEELVRQRRDVYFGLGKYKTDENREAHNCGWMQSFFLDIDCGPTKAVPDKHGRIQGYIDQPTGLRALKDLCAGLNLPKPTIVDSGRGWHVYWPLTESVTVDKWLPVAQTFKAKCAELKIIVDPAVPADAARILRVPGTFNYKDGEALEVRVLHTAQPMTFDEFAAHLGPITPAKPVQPPRQLDEFTKSLLGNRQSRFRTIVEKTVAGNGCEQLRYLMENQENVEEPLWRAGLSIAKHCVDGDKAIHIISKHHPEYNPSNTEAKASRIKGPYTCEVFNDFRPGVCINCQHWKKIKSPIVIGHEIAKYDGEEPIETKFAVGQEPTTDFVMPTLPKDYFRGKTGGIYCYLKSDEPEEGEEPVVRCVYEYDLFVMKRLYDPGNGETLLLRLTLPRDGSREFPITTEDLLSQEEFRKVLSFQGILADKPQMILILRYILACAKELQVIQEVEMMRLQFGWADDDSKFIVGTREIGAGYERYSPPSRATSIVAPAMRPTGDFDVWKSVINVYGMPGFEPHAFAVFSAFGAPLIKFMGIKGSIINLINNRSGTGKSTILQVMNSVWGHPDELMLQWRDTLNVKLHRMAVMCNLPIGVDEITKMSGDDFSDLAYSVTQGAPRRRMKASVNEEREATGFWATIMVCTSNSSMTDKLEALKATAEGELMRLMQYKIDPTNNISKSEAKHIFGQLQGHHGLAGGIYAKYLVPNLEEVVDLCLRTQRRFDEAAKIETRERFWSATAAANLTGALIAQKLGLHDINMKHVFDWAVNEVQNMQTATRLSMDDYAGVIGEFLLKHNQNILVVNNRSTSKAGIAAAPIVMPKGAILVRYEPDTERIFIIRNTLKEFCVSKQITFNDMLAALSKEKSFINSVRTRIDIGTELHVPPVEVLEFDALKLGLSPTVASNDD